MASLGRFQHWHLAAAGRAPGGPEVDHQWAAVQLVQVDRVALQVAQGELGQLAALIEGREDGAGAAPEQTAHGQGNGQRPA
ncbi:hypothetical protein D3C81_1831560 [compost metagenome]